MEAEFGPWSGCVLKVSLSQWICKQEQGYFAGKSNAVDAFPGLLIVYTNWCDLTPPHRLPHRKP